MALWKIHLLYLLESLRKLAYFVPCTRSSPQEPPGSWAFRSWLFPASFCFLR
jgi:hypothetical protein